MQRIFPSLFCADLLNLQASVGLLEPYVAGFHLDCMDFHFVSNLALSLNTINQLADITSKPLQIHLMVEYPERYLEQLKLPNNSRILIHPESPSEMPFDELIKQVCDYGWSPSVALNPQLSIDFLGSIKTPIDHILLMGVEPGFAGQKLIPSTYLRLREIQKLLYSMGKSLPVAVDGGVSADNAQDLIHAGATELIMGSALFTSDNPQALLEKLNLILT